MIGRALLAWVVFDALVLALLLSQARGFVVAVGWLLVLAVYVAAAGVVWAVLTPCVALADGVRWVAARGER